MRTDNYTKTVLTVIAIMLTVIAFSEYLSPRYVAQAADPCQGAQANQRSSLGSQSTKSAKHAGSLNDEARNVANRLASAEFRKCGDSYLADPRYAPTLNFPLALELKGVQFGIEPISITAADQLNKIQWHGFATIKFAASREGAGLWEPYNGESPNIDRFYESYALHSSSSASRFLLIFKKGGKWFVMDRHSPNAYRDFDDVTSEIDDFVKQATPPACSASL